MVGPSRKYFWGKQTEEEKQQDQNEGGLTILRMI
jgi:hypothetical protein